MSQQESQEQEQKQISESQPEVADQEQISESQPEVSDQDEVPAQEVQAVMEDREVRDTAIDISLSALDQYPAV